MKKALKSLLRASEKVLEIDTLYRKMGYPDNPFFEIFGHISDAVYELVGEKKEDYADSFTCFVMNENWITEDDKLKILMAIYTKNRPARL